MTRDLTLSYKNHRRKRLQPLPAPPLSPPPFAGSIPSTGDGLAPEIAYLRQAFVDLAHAHRRARSLDDQLRIIQTLSLVADRMAGLLLAHQKLTAKDKTDLGTWLGDIADEVLQEMRAKY